ncbi:Agamous-like MADS-box protein AGL104 [Linum grandiflorum]
MVSHKFPLRKRKKKFASSSYCKQRNGMVKKANELSEQCGVDVGLIMFSPKGKLSTFATEGKVEDVFLRYIEQSGQIENQENLYRSLKQLRFESEMLEKLARIETLEEKLQELNKQKSQKQEQLQCYNFDVQKISSISDALLHQEFLTHAIQPIQGLKLQPNLISHMKLRNPESVEAVDQRAKEPMDSEKYRNQAWDHGGSSSAGPHLSLEFLTKHKHWNLKIQ